MNTQLSFIPIGGIGDVTRNLYIYELASELLIVDCGLGFADETMLGVDLLLPDISYILQSKKKIVGLLLTHGHEDHIGALPFILPQLFGKKGQPPFPMYATPLTAAFANRKLKEFNVTQQVKPVAFDSPPVRIGSFTAEFIRVTHSVPDTSHIFIQTPVGNFYHGSDFKFDDTPVDGKVTDYEKIARVSQKGILCLLSDCLGSERPTKMQSEIELTKGFEREIRQCRGKFIVTTYSSNIARLNQIIGVSQKTGRKVVFVGRSLINAKDIAQKLGLLQMGSGTEVQLDEIKRYNDTQLTFIVAGSQGQENSGLARIANGEHREVKLCEEDTVVFSADPIPGNEVIINELIDTIAKRGSRIVYSAVSRDFHVSGHGSLEEMEKLINLTRPKKLIPIGGNFRHMVVYRELAYKKGYKKSDVFLLEDGQEVVFSQNSAHIGKIVPVQSVYVDEISGEELEGFVLRDRQKLSEGGIVIILAEIDSATTQLVGVPEIIARGFTTYDSKRLSSKILQELSGVLKNRRGRVTNWVYLRKLIGEVSERRIFRDLHRRPLVLPIVIEV